MMNIREMVEFYGIDNLIVKFSMLPLHSMGGLFSYTSSGDKPQKVHCKIVENQYQVSEGYKIDIRAVGLGYGGETFYQSDFSDLVQDGRIQIFAYIHGRLIDVSQKMKYEESPCNP